MKASKRVRDLETQLALVLGALVALAGKRDDGDSIRGLISVAQDVLHFEPEEDES